MKKQPSPGRILVEFYDSEHLENIVSLLYGVYSGVTYVYFTKDNEPDPGDRRALAALIRGRFGFSPRFLEIPEDTVECALDSFRRLVASGGPHDFDVTGGSSIFIAAAGALLSETGGRDVSIHEYDTATGACIFRCPAGAPAERRTSPERLSVPEVLELRGVAILNEREPLRRDLGRDDLRGEILRLWSAVRGDLREWNSFCTSSFHTADRGSYLRAEKRMSAHDRQVCGVILDRLARAGILSHLEERAEDNRVCLSFRLSVPWAARFLYEKAGNLLEMLTYLAAVESGLFADCCAGVKLDWDGERRDARVNPSNELDLVMTLGHIPHFVSCKNTGVEKEFLYEILTMTRHFGGAHAVPVLVSTAEVNQAVSARAREMGIILIDRVHAMTAADLSKRLRAVLRPPA